MVGHCVRGGVGSASTRRRPPDDPDGGDGFLTLDLDEFDGLADVEAKEGPSTWEGRWCVDATR